jgi:hypothetical protein
MNAPAFVATATELLTYGFGSLLALSFLSIAVIYRGR